MRASFVIGFHTARINNLLQTLRFLVKDHKDLIKDCQLVTICQNVFTDPNGDLKKLGKFFAAHDHRNLVLTEMMLPRVTNLGVLLAKSDKLIILESDRLLPAGYFEEVIEELKPGVCITCKNMKKLAKNYIDSDIITGHYDYKDEYRSDSNQIGMRNMWSGNTAITKEDYIKAGRMDEGYVGYGWADSDMTNRTNRIGVKNIFKENHIELHLWHEPATYGSSDQKLLFVSNGMKFCRTWNVPIPDWLAKDIAKYIF